MRITFLGGAEEIGASCAIVDTASARFMVDCGQRMGAPAGELLPDFSYLQNGRPIDAILLTHAHTDHIGALGAIESWLPADCPIFGTEATLAIAKVMLQDSQRIISQHRQGDGQMAHFPPAAVGAVVSRFEGVNWGKSLRLAGCKVRWFPAGHILGAAMIEIQDGKQSVLFSGDISVADQKSVPGVFAPAIHPNILVLESTYGDRQHAHRPTQEKRLVQRVGKCIADGGHVLFPTFALGRAQEVLVILSEAMRSGTLPEVPVYADGMVRSISRVYNRFPEELSQVCRRRYEQGLDPIFPEDLPIFRVRDDRERQGVALGPPAVVVASSGMLQGGASQFYARQWIGMPENLILITGYQDEESPGQALLDLAAGAHAGPHYFKLGGVRTEVRCGVESFELSAHADNSELVSLASKFKADVIFPVHGEGGSRQTLAQSLMAVCKAEVVLPENGASYEFPWLQERPRPIAARMDPLSAWPPWDPSEDRPLKLSKFHDWLATIQPKIEWITFEELGEIWKSPDPITDDERRRLHHAVYQDWQRYFVPDAKRPHLLRITPKENLESLPASSLREGMALAREILREIFPPISGLMRFGFYPEEGVCQLEFTFPAQAETQFQERFRLFEERTGWSVRLAGMISDEDLTRFAHDLLRRPIPVEVRREKGEVLVHSSLPTTDDVDGDEEDVADRFRRRTGFRLVFVD